MGIMQLQPNLGEGALADGYRTPRGTALRSVLGRGDQTACEYRTAHDVTLWPLKLAHAEYTGYVADLGDVGNLPRRPKGALRLKLRTTAGLKFSDLALDELTLFIRGSDDLPVRLYEQAIGHTIAVVARPATRPAGWQHLIADNPVVAVGLQDDEASAALRAPLVPGVSPAGGILRLPVALLVRQAQGLAPAVRRCTAAEMEIVVLTDSHERALDGAVASDHLALFCTPAVNLFPRTANRIHVSEGTTEFHVVPDRTRPMDFEVHSIREVMGFGASADAKQTVPSLLLPGTQPSRPAKRPLTTRYSASRGCSPPSSARVGPDRATWAVSCSCRSSIPTRHPTPPASVSLPSKPCARTAICPCTFHWDRDAPISRSIPARRSAIRCITGPTAPRASHADGRPPGASSATCRSTTCPWSTAPAAPAKNSGRPARAVAALRRHGRHRFSQADRRDPRHRVGRYHQGAPGAGADQLRPWPGSHRHLR